MVPPTPATTVPALTLAVPMTATAATPSTMPAISTMTMATTG
jgi:hypothetical protein